MTDNFQQDTRNFCFLANVRNYLQFHGLNVSEDWLGGILGLVGFRINQDVRGADYLFGFNGDFQELFIRFEALFTHKLTRIDVPVIQDLEQMRRTPYLIWVNDFYLEYSPNYGVKDCGRIVVFLHLSEERFTYYDNGIRELDTDIFAKAAGFGDGLVTLYTFDGLPVWKEDRYLMERRGLLGAVKHMNMTSHGDMLLGYDGLNKLCETIRTHTGEEQIYPIYFQLQRPGGLAQSRLLMSRFIAEIKRERDIYGDSEDEEFHDLSEQWRMIANLLFKLSHTMEEDLRARIIERVMHAVQSERKAFAGLEQLATRL
ncbi:MULTISPECIES: hypothetical protein [unclassified Paenibacillus]|uniref:hypothetical protein n=1 Tax=unclassified Paenibacillus TaxID=185978 RepID=UPI0030FB5598